MRLNGFVVLLLLTNGAFCYPGFRQLLPNGDRIPHPCDRSRIWKGLGHENAEGGGVLNSFGSHFKQAGKVWSKTLCRQDSDGDGLTNGQELGDPDCLWTSGATPAVSNIDSLSHPGICEPIDSPQCNNRNPFLSKICADNMKPPANTCIPPNSPPNGFIVETSLTTEDFYYHPGGFIEYQCDGGYAMVGDAKIYCKENGNWSALPTCRFSIKMPVATCPAPTVVPDNAYVANVPSVLNNGRFAVGSIVIYACNLGYQASGYGVITCLQSGAWSNYTLNCTAANFVPRSRVRQANSQSDSCSYCSLPTLPSNVLVVNGQQPSNQYSIGATIMLGCPAGYTPIGPCSFIKCLSSGNFSQVFLTCQPNGCPTPSPPTNAQIQSVVTRSPTGVFMPGDSVTYGCNPGCTDPAGSTALSVCLQDGTWQSCPLQCQCSPKPRTCPMPSAPQNAQIVTSSSIPSNGQSYTTGDCILYACNDGFTQVGNNLQSCCRDDTTWTQVAFFCQPLPAPSKTCSSPNLPSNACIIDGPPGVNGTYQEDDTLTLGCIDGYTPTGSPPQICCLGGGEWSTTELMCMLTATTQMTTPPPAATTATCPTADMPNHSIMISNGRSTSSPDQYAVSDWVQYGCQDGYTIFGTIQCRADGSWTGYSMSCQPTSRGFLTHPNSIAPSLAPSGSSNQCTAPRPPNNASPVSSSPTYSVGEFIQYACNAGYSVSGIMTCLRDGTWSAAIFVCSTNSGSMSSQVLPSQLPPLLSGSGNKAPSNTLNSPMSSGKCAPPKIPAYAQTIAQLVPIDGSTTFPVGSFFVFQCATGYRLVGDSIIICNADGTWTEAPACARKVTAF